MPRFAGAWSMTSPPLETRDTLYVRSCCISVFRPPRRTPRGCGGRAGPFAARRSEPACHAGHRTRSSPGRRSRGPPAHCCGPPVPGGRGTSVRQLASLSAVCWPESRCGIRAVRTLVPGWPGRPSTSCESDGGCPLRRPTVRRVRARRGRPPWSWSHRRRTIPLPEDAEQWQRHPPGRRGTGAIGATEETAVTERRCRSRAP